MVSRGKVNSKRQLQMKMTSYLAFCDTGCIGITRTGIDVRNTIYHQGMRIIAVDPRVIKLHSIVRVYTENESFLAYAADTGGAIKGNIIDLLVENMQVARQNGRQTVTVEILKEGKGD